MKTLSTAAATIAFACLAIASHKAAAFPGPGALLDRPADVIQVNKKHTAPKPKVDPSRPNNFGGIDGETINKDHDKGGQLARRRR